MNISQLPQKNNTQENSEIIAIAIKNHIAVYADLSTQCRAKQALLENSLRDGKTLTLTQRHSFALTTQLFEGCDQRLMYLRNQFFLYASEQPICANINTLCGLNQKFIDALDEYTTILYGYEELHNEICSIENATEQLKDEMTELFPDISEEEINSLLWDAENQEKSISPYLDINHSKKLSLELQDEMKALFPKITQEELDELMNEEEKQRNLISIQMLDDYLTDCEAKTWIDEAMEKPTKSKADILEDELYSLIQEWEKENINTQSIFNTAKLIINSEEPSDSARLENYYFYNFITYALMKSLVYIAPSSYNAIEKS